MKLRACLPVAATTLAAFLAAAPAAAAPARPAAASPAGTATPVKHFIFLMQGGRTFDNYFGRYPGADGPPAGTCQARVAGQPGAGCVKPYPLGTAQVPALGASRAVIAEQYDNGKMDGFVSAYQRQARNGASVMGYYDRRELPFYWNVADRYVLFDHFFSDARYGVRVNRSYWVSAAPAPGGRGGVPAGGYGSQLTIFDRLQAAGISWKFYVQGYKPSETYQTASPANPETQTSRVPLVDYARFVHNPALSQHIAGLTQYYRDLAAGTLPAVSYIASSSGDNERSAGAVAGGQKLVRNLVTQLMQSRYWSSSALLWSYDGSGGWFDHVPPPRAGSGTLGFRVPALLVSPYARQGQVNHTVLDYTSGLRFIEDNWHLPPLTSTDAHANSLASAFDFAAAPRPPVLIPANSLPVSSGTIPAAGTAAATPAGKIYWLYGTAAVASIVLLFFAAWSARRRFPIAARDRTDAEEIKL